MLPLHKYMPKTGNYSFGKICCPTGNNRKIPVDYNITGKQKLPLELFFIFIPMTMKKSIGQVHVSPISKHLPLLG